MNQSILKKKYIYAALLLLLPVFVFAQTVISGKIYDAQTREPMPYVNLQLKNTVVGTSSDYEGNYKIVTASSSDSILVSYIGYKSAAYPIKNHQKQEVNIFLEPEASALSEVLIHPGENPAWRIMRQVMNHKEQNDPTKIDAYQEEVYNKIEFDLNNISPKVEKGKLLKPINFIFKNIDSSNVKEKPYLPVFISEASSDYYYRKNPRFKKEIIKATKLSGFKNQSVAQFTGDMYQDIDIYKNTFVIFAQAFNSPISYNWNIFYKYYLVDSMTINGHWCYQIRFKPKHKQEFAFSGNMWIADTSFALIRLEMTMPGDININFIQNFSVIEEYTLIDNTYWMQSKNKLIIDFALEKNGTGLYGRKTTLYRNFVVNQPKDNKFYNISNNIEVEDSAEERSAKYWDSIRQEPLSKNEKNIYKMVDTVQTLPIYRHTYNGAILLLTGYKTFGDFDMGPVADFYSYNTVEGNRLRFGGRTSNKFSERYEFNGYAAYGFLDEKIKYNLGFKTLINKNPWQLIDASYTDDLQILGRSDDLFGRDNILASVLSRAPITNLTRVQEARLTYDRDIFTGLECKLSFINRVYTPLPNNPYTFSDNTGQVLTKPDIHAPALQFSLNFSYDDKYVVANLSRIDVGTRYPTLIFRYTAGLQGIFQGDYPYHKIVLGLSYTMHVNPFGDTRFYLEAGKIFGAVPYPLMELPSGNETYIYDENAYNMMNYYEFASDQYFGVNVEHHFEGYFFNKVPFFRKLKWREIAGYKTLIGSVNPESEQLLLFPPGLRALSNGPYSEADVGVENIFKFLRIDALWRLSYLNDPNVSRFAIMGTLQLIF
jgi:Family of unknown function (DUF5686)/CarboxypepD_reg-like domain